MPLKKARMCADCRALGKTINYDNFKCFLQYPIDIKRIHLRGGGYIDRPVPQEQCPKPRTWDEFYELF